MGANVIAVMLPPGDTFLGVMDRVWDEGDALLPIPWGAPDAIVRQIVTSLRPHALVRPDEHGQPQAERLKGAHPAPVGGGLVVVTSGTTGEPKGVELGRDAVTASTRESLRTLGCERGDRWLTCLPLHHVAGLQTILRARYLSAEPIVHDRFDPVAIAAERNVDWISLVPTQLARLLHAGVDVSGLDGVLLGGAPPLPGLLARAEAAGVRVVTSYGMTETGGGCVYDGIPFDRISVEVREDHRIRIRGPVVMHGYRNDPVLTEQRLRQGWFLTNDVGRLDDDGRLEVFGRADDVIITGGENVSARAVADAIITHDAVADVHVVGRPHPEWGEEVTALVVPSDPTSPPTLDDLRDHGRGSLPDHALPRAVRIAASLGRDAMGKVRRATVAELFDDA